MKIALDAMSGDHGSQVVVPAALNVLKKCPKLELILVGDEETLTRQLKLSHSSVDNPRISIRHSTQVVTMDEMPSRALRSKKDSSMRVAVNLVKKGEADACVSAGNTGALMAITRFVLKTIPGIDRPAIISELPTFERKCRVLDLGANVDSCAEHLLQFAIMGSVLVSAVDSIQNPSVGLLNIGVEEIKGNDQVKRTAQLLSENRAVNYIGYVEGDDIFKGTVDVIVCDGFVGNVALKASEGIAKLFVHNIQVEFNKNIFKKMISLIARSSVRAIKNRMDPSRYNGASFLGVKGIVVKSHGSANVEAFENAIYEAIKQVEQNVPQLIHDHVAALMGESE